jgi:hypothetical protein
MKWAWSKISRGFFSTNSFADRYVRQRPRHAKSGHAGRVWAGRPCRAYRFRPCRESREFQRGKHDACCRSCGDPEVARQKAPTSGVMPPRSRQRHITGKQNIQQSQIRCGPGSRQIRGFESAASTTPSSFPFPHVSSCRNELRTATTQGLAVAMKQKKSGANCEARNCGQMLTYYA